MRMFVDFWPYLGHRKIEASLSVFITLGLFISLSIDLKESSGLVIVSTSNPNITDPITFIEYLKEVHQNRIKRNKNNQ